jgi:hypothetical protein
VKTMEAPMQNRVHSHKDRRCWIAANMILAALLSASPAGAQFETETSKKLCGLVQPADLMVLLKASKPPTLTPRMYTCMCMAPEKGKPPAYLSISLVQAEKGESPEQAFTRMRAHAMKDARVLHTRDESGIGDHAFAYFQEGVQGLFVVFTKGQGIIFMSSPYSDLDTLRPIVKKAVAAY